MQETVKNRTHTKENGGNGMEGKLESLPKMKRKMTERKSQKDGHAEARTEI